jgi:hypothetical protein
MPEIAFWRNLAASFRELHEQQGNNLGAHWSSSAWNASGSHWHLDTGGNQTVRGSFRVFAERGAVELGHSDESTGLDFWLDLLKTESHHFREGGESRSFGKGEPEVVSQNGSIKSVCKASSEFCIKCETKELLRTQPHNGHPPTPSRSHQPRLRGFRPARPIAISGAVHAAAH